MKLVTDCLKYTFARNVLFNIQYILYLLPIQYILYLLPIYYVYELTQATLFCISNNRIILIGWITMRYTTAYLKIIPNGPINMYYYYVSFQINFYYILS
jgi:hypothetical protein